MAMGSPLIAGGQELRGQTRLIGVLVPFSKTDPEMQALLAAFKRRFQELGWTDRDVRLEYRFTDGNSEQIRAAAAELVELKPDVILAHGASTAGRLLQVTRTVPIVFPVVFDPVGAGLVDSLSRPGGNVTGFMTTEYSIGGKWLELLKQIAPGVTRVAVFEIPLLRPALPCSGSSRPRQHRLG
jgi:putative tryptophan/tyrosine transport system substrate-binding protein